MRHFLPLVFVLACGFRFAEPHGRLIEPPSRSSMWRYGFHSRPNYNDHELYCGGYSRQWQRNDGKCGICGDPWDSKLPRDNEAGGLYGQGIITRKYQKADTIKIRIQLTANHMGYFEFRLCPNNNKKVAASQSCLDQYVLKKERTLDTKYYPGPGAKIFEMSYDLPSDLTCTQCILQWKYIAGNNWGLCANGSGAVGCGPQEEFRACSDITITEMDGSADDTVNNVFDPISYVPTLPTSTPTPTTSSTSEITFVETNDLDEDVSFEDQIGGRRMQWESILLISTAAILFTGLFFGSLFFYFLKVKDFIQNFHKRQDLSTLPEAAGGGQKSFSYRCRGLLQSVSLWKKPEGSCSPSKKKKVTISSELPTIYTNEALVCEESESSSSDCGNPIPPPRMKKNAPRLATINSRGPIQRPSLPPPTIPEAVNASLLIPPKSSPPPPILQISHPTSVTINGVSVPRSVPLDDSVGVIAQARFALARDDIPDSSVESIPPPLPMSTPPPLNEDEIP